MGGAPTSYGAPRAYFVRRAQSHGDGLSGELRGLGDGLSGELRGLGDGDGDGLSGELRGLGDGDGDGLSGELRASGLRGAMQRLRGALRALPWVLVACVAGCGDGASSSGSGTTSSAGGTSTTSTGGTSTGGTGDGGTTSTSNSQTLTGGGGSGAGGGATGGGGAGGDTTGGTGGATAGSGGGTTSSTSNTASGPMLGDPCALGDDCGGTILYCEAPGCVSGTCQPRPPAAGLSPDPDPVCGCDGITYWSPDVAASKGQSVAAPGACAMPIVCGPNMPCPAGKKCNRPVADSLSCDPGALGECWATALSCPLDGPKARGCVSSACELQCSLVQSENPWFEDAGCL